MKTKGFRYAATTARGRQIRNFVWLPAFFPLAVAEPLVTLVLRLAYAEVKEVEADPLLSLRVHPEIVALFARRLAVMVAAGIPLHESVNFLAHSEDDDMNIAASRLARYIETGHSFGNALSLLPGVFPAVFQGFARAGEASGKLVQALESLSTQLERSVWMKRRIRSALGYPLFLMIGAVILSGLLIFGIVPQMVPALQQLGVELPALTTLLLRFTEVGSKPLVLLSSLLLGIGLFSGLAFTLSETGRFTRLRRQLDAFQLHVPILGQLAQRYASARVLSATAMSVETGISVTKALFDSSGLAGNVIIEERVLKICDSIGRGVPLEEALEEHGAFSSAETQVLICASEAGELAKGMASMAKHAEEELESTIAALTSLLEPLILAVMSVVVGVVCLATFLPWITLLQSIL